MTNAEVIALCSAGIGDDLVIAKIRTAPATDFDTGIEAIKALQAGHVPASVIRFMIDPNGPAPSSTPKPGVPQAFSRSDDPTEIHAPGIYIYAGSGTGPKLTILQRVTVKQSKHTGSLIHAATQGIIPSKTRAVLENAHAPTRTSDENPVFYLYAASNESSFGGTVFVPQQFTLVKFAPKNDTRELVEGSYGLFSMTSGIENKAKQGFTATEVSPGIHKLVLAQPLPAGEYAFALNRAVFFDFSILNEK